MDRLSKVILFTFIALLVYYSELPQWIAIFPAIIAMYFVLREDSAGK